MSEFLDLSGEGGRLFPARWHSAGRSIVYTAEHSALALLESLVHLEEREEISTYQLLEIEAADDVLVTSFPAALPPVEIETSSAWGDAWLAAGKTALASVPSMLAPAARNILINPEHPNAGAIKLVRHARYEWDPRLFARA